MASVRRVVDLQCKECGTTFQAVRSNTERCPACRAEHHRAVVREYEHAHTKGVGKGQYLRVATWESTCVDCGKTFIAKREHARHCPDCRPLWNRIKSQESEQRRQTPCVVCGKPTYRGSQRCRKCDARRRADTGIAAKENNPNWKGGRTRHKQGYIMVRNPDPNARPRYQMEHILVWQQANGLVPKGWHVHHLNGDKIDNRLENLVAMSASDHHSNKGLAPYEERIRHLEARLRAHGLPID